MNRAKDRNNIRRFPLISMIDISFCKITIPDKQINKVSLSLQICIMHFNHGKIV